MFGCFGSIVHEKCGGESNLPPGKSCVTWQELCLAGPGSSVQCWAQDVSPDAWQVCCLFECGLNLALWCMLTGSCTSYVDLQKWILQHFRCHLLMHHCQSAGMFRLLHSALHSKEFVCCICVSFGSCVQMCLSLHFLWIDFLFPCQ